MSDNICKYCFENKATEQKERKVCCSNCKEKLSKCGKCGSKEGLEIIHQVPNAPGARPIVEALCQFHQNKREVKQDKRNKSQNPNNNSEKKIYLKQIEQELKDNNIIASYLEIKSISLEDNGDLRFKFVNGWVRDFQADDKEMKSSQLQQIKSYLKQNPSKVISIDNLAEREREREQNQSKSNTLLYFSLGLGAIALIGGLVYWFTRKNNKKE